jgi:hypothetical protein
MLHSLFSQIAICALLLLCVFALLKGESAERWGAFFVFISWIGGDVLSFLLHDALSRHLFEIILTVMDGFLAVGFLGLALRFAKIWLGLAMLLQSGELALHAAAMGVWDLKFFYYIYLNNALSYGLLLLLSFATVMAWQRRARRRDAG